MRVAGEGILVAGNFGSPFLPGRAFAQLLAADGGQVGPPAMLLHVDDYFLGTHAFAADVFEDQLVLAGAVDEPDGGTTYPRAWHVSQNFKPSRERAPTPSEFFQVALAGTLRFNGAVHISSYEGGRRFPLVLCSAGPFSNAGGTGAFFHYTEYAHYGAGSALNVSANSVAWVEDHCVSVGRADARAVLLDLRTLPFREDYATPPVPIDPATFVLLTKGSSSEALHISAAGDIVGWEAPADFSEQPAIRVKGKDDFLRPLPLPPAWRSGRALASTRSPDGRVFAVGSGIDERGNKRALFWADGGDVFPLDRRVSGRQSGWLLEEATAIDAQLDIVGNGRHGDLVRAFLLIPAGTP